MKTAMAFAVLLIVAVSTFGQTSPRFPSQQFSQPREFAQSPPRAIPQIPKAMPIPNWPANERAPIIQIPTDVRSQQGELTNIPRVRAVPIPNSPEDKPAPVIPIPTEIQPQNGQRTAIPHFAPSEEPPQACLAYVKNCSKTISH
jgi:hypothetical protein